jgi:endonuclease YncB( thermonuclease family)
MPALAAAAGLIDGPAIVEPDATLIVTGKRIVLDGVYVPESGRHCDTSVIPPRCGSRAALALDAKIQGFVACEPRAAARDGRTPALCRVGRTAFVEGEDLGLYLIRLGLALATPAASFAYHAEERIARERGRGVWGTTTTR